MVKKVLDLQITVTIPPNFKSCCTTFRWSKSAALSVRQFSPTQVFSTALVSLKFWFRVSSYARNYHGCISQTIHPDNKCVFSCPNKCKKTKRTTQAI